MSKRKRIKFLLFFCFFSLLLLEIVLRIIGYQAGIISPHWLNFKGVDTLEVFSSFNTNEKGLFVADKLFFINQYDINNDGFRSQPFLADSTRKSIFFLGDSYTWGSMATPIDSCFVGLVENTGYQVYNTGIPGADPPQYLAVAKEYIPLLKPDYVILMFYAGNDFIYHDRVPVANQNLYHITNAGWLSPFISGGYEASPYKVYNYYLDKYKIGSKAPFWKKCMSKSVIGTLLLSIPERIKEKKIWQQNTQIGIDYVKKIKEISEVHNCVFKLFIIPLHTKISSKTFIEYQNLFSPIEIYYPENLSRKDFYDWPNGHLKNSGHKKYARKIIEIIKK